MRLLSWLLLVPLMLLVGLFTASNLNPVEVRLEPFAGGLRAGLYAVVLVSVLLGLLIGLVVGWLSGGPRRRRARQLANLNTALARRVNDLQRDQTALQAKIVEHRTGESMAAPPAVRQS